MDRNSAKTSNPTSLDNNQESKVQAPMTNPCEAIRKRMGKLLDLMNSREFQSLADSENQAKGEQFRLDQLTLTRMMRMLEMSCHSAMKNRLEKHLREMEAQKSNAPTTSDAVQRTRELFDITDCFDAFSKM